MMKNIENMFFIREYSTEGTIDERAAHRACIQAYEDRMIFLRTLQSKGILFEKENDAVLSMQMEIDPFLEEIEEVQVPLVHEIILPGGETTDLSLVKYDLNPNNKGKQPADDLMSSSSISSSGSSESENEEDKWTPFYNASNTTTWQLSTSPVASSSTSSSSSVSSTVIPSDINKNGKRPLSNSSPATASSSSNALSSASPEVGSSGDNNQKKSLFNFKPIKLISKIRKLPGRK